MGSLTHCISIHELQKPIAEKIRAKQKEYLTDGYDGAQATQKAVSDIMGVSKSQRSDIIEQVNKQLESDHPEILPKEEHPGIDRIRKDIKEDIQQVDKEDESTKVLQKLAKKFKKKIVFFKGSKKVNGTFDPVHPDTLFINTATDKAMLFVFGHELLHNLKQDDHTLYVDLFKVLFNHVNNFDTFFEKENAKRKEKGLKVLTPVQMAEEFFADFTGEQFTDEKFWQKLIEKDKTLFDKVADLFGKLFRRVGDTSSDYFRDINRAQDALATVMKRYTDGQKAEAKKVKLKEAQATKKAQAEKLKQSQAAKKEKLRKEKATPAPKYSAKDLSEKYDPEIDYKKNPPSLFVKALKMIKGRMPEAHNVLVYQQEQSAGIKAMVKAAPTMNIERLSDQTDKTYDAVMAIDVVNHVDPGERAAVIKDIISRISDTGSAIIAAREWVGFEGGDLVAQVTRAIGDQFTVEPVKGFGDVAVLVKKGGVNTTTFGKFKTGIPVSFDYAHNTESATGIFGKPKKDSPYGRGFEPSGKYMVETSIKSQIPTIENGTVSFENPLVVETEGWKKNLSDSYGSLSGKKLSQALIADGYDGVVTVGKHGTSEILDLTSFDVSKALYSTKDLTITLNIDTDWMPGRIDPKNIPKTREEIALQNTKVEILEKLWEGEYLSYEELAEIKDMDGKDFDLEFVEKALKEVGETRSIEDIYEEMLGYTESENEVADIWEPSNNINEWAKAAIGTTDNIGLAGYVLSDGALLDFSEERQGGGYDRSRDHRQLGDIPILEDRTGDISPTEFMNEFMKSSGAIRIDYNSGMVDVQTIPTGSQIKTINEVLENGDPGYLSMGDERQIEVHGTKRVKGLLNKYFKGEDISDDPLYSTKDLNQAPFYSQMTRFLTDKLPGKSDAKALSQMIKGWVKKGQFKQDELDWSGVIEWLSSFNKTSSNKYFSDVTMSNFTSASNLGDRNAIAIPFPSNSDIPSNSGLLLDANFIKRLAANTHNLRNLPAPKSLREKDFSSLNIDFRRFMIHGMLTSLHNRKIAQDIIKSIPIDVMHNLIGKKLSPQAILNDLSVLKDSLTIDYDSSIPTSVDRAMDSAVRLITNRGAKIVNMLFNVGRGLSEFNSTITTLNEIDRVGTDSRTKVSDVPGNVALTSTENFSATLAFDDHDSLQAIVLKILNYKPDHTKSQVKDGKVTKQQVLDYLEENQVQVEEVVKGGAGFEGRAARMEILVDLENDGSITDEERDELDILEREVSAGTETEDDTKFSQYTLEGSENYRELLLTLPTKSVPVTGKIEKLPSGKWLVTSPGGSRDLFATEKDAIKETERLGKIFKRESFVDTSSEYQSGHYEEPNILAHIRFNERLDADGNKVLFIEEIQSDWGQDARKKGVGDGTTIKKDSNGFFRAYDTNNNEIELRTDDGVFVALNSEQAVRDALPNSFGEKGVPNAPFITSTPKWSMLAMKHAIRWAAENGFDKVAWTTGEQQAARYDLSKQVNTIGHRPVGKEGDTHDLQVMGGPNNQVLLEESNISIDRVEELVGKEVAKKISNDDGYSDGRWLILEGDDLKVGGEPMKDYYDNILRIATKNYIKKWGAKVAPIDAGTGTEQWGFDVTDKMRDSVMQGQPLYSTKDLDEKYTAAVEKDDMETAQKMVDAAAEKAGYNVGPVYHGTDEDFTVFTPMGGKVVILWKTFDVDREGFFFAENKEMTDAYGEKLMSVYLKAKTPALLDENFDEIYNKVESYGVNFGWYQHPGEFGNTWEMFDDADGKLFAEALQKAGYDSAIFEDQNPETQENFKAHVAFNPNQIKSADPVTYDDNGKVIPLSKRFKEESEDIRYSTKDFDEVVKEVFQSPEDAENTIERRVINAFKLVTDSDRRDDFRQHLDSIRTAIVDRYAPIDRHLGKTIYKLHRMLNNSAATFGTFLQHGNLSWQDDALTVTTKDEGFVPWMKSLGEDGHKFLYWVAAKRAEKLSEEDRENWFTKTKRDVILDEVESRKMTEQYEKWNKKLQAYNSNIIDIAQEAGLIGEDARERWMSHYYLPFYRVLENEDTAEEFSKGPISSRKYITSGVKTLKGGEAAIGDPMHNLIRNWSHLIAESQRQMARSSASEFMIDLGMAEEMTAGQLKKVLGVNSTYGVKGLNDDGKINWKDFKDSTRAEVMEVVDTTPGTSLIEKQIINSVPDVRKSAKVMSFMRDGKPVYVKVEDPALYEALTQVNMKSVNNSLVGGLGFFKRLLTMGATFGPAFRVANFLRDTLHTAVVSKSFFPFVDSAKGLVQVWRQSPDYIALMASGGGFSQGYLNSADPKALSRTIDKIIKNEGKSSTNFILDTPRKLLDFWEEVGHASEMAARVQLYTNLTTKKGDIPGESHLSGAYEAKDLLDFGLTGNYEAVRILTATIPFLNARMQGLDRMGRGVAADPRAFLTKGAIVAAASLALWAAYRDDDRYKELEDWDKWQYHHFWIGDKHCRIPKAFEVGAVFSTLFEAGAESMTDEEGFGYFCDMLKHTFLNTFAIGYPTAFAPLAEVYANKSFFTGRDIEPEWMQGLKPGARFNPWESETLKAVGKNLNISPTKLHTLIRGYTATIGMGLLATADVMMEFREDVKTPEKYFHEYTGLDRFVKTKPGSTKYATRYYEFASAATETFNTINNYQRTGNMDLARQMAKDNPGYKARKDYITLVNRHLSTLRAEEKSVWGNLSISRENKRKKLESLRRKKNEVYKRAYTFTKKKFKK